ncbi:CoA transferase [Egibacter rhizosphaerae]|uniref:CoA transferase n=1 Tax=Egibacter rhizosphaerae TaxID=1670831 RepID=A0A411YBJ2_9ACTN|nr:CoA transferase [Egibacter rhizosphaerae]QBI18570.1 CoA transferase [Egibacter rhizosphaerae]
MSRGGPLAGVRVVDLSRAMAGPYATLMLGDAGADVIKVERPDTGDDTRSWGPPFVDDGDRSHSAYFLSVNRNKRSISLDLKDPDDLVVLGELIESADVLVENFRPGVMDRLGFGHETLRERNPQLVQLSITGFGHGGPEGHRAGFDQIVQGEGGLMSITGQRGDQPTKVGVPIADILAGMFGAFGVVSALQERDRTGRGQTVRTSLLAGMVAVHTFQGTRWLVAGEEPRASGNHHPLIAPYGAFECADGSINIAVGSEGLWQRFAPLVALDPQDVRFATNRDRVERTTELAEAMAPALQSADAATWVARLEEEGIPAGRIRTISETYASAQVAHLGLIDEVAHPTLGALQLPSAPVAFGEGHAGDSTHPPLLGEHSEEILAELGRRAAGQEVGGTAE